MNIYSNLHDLSPIKTTGAYLRKTHDLPKGSLPLFNCVCTGTGHRRQISLQDKVNALVLDYDSGLTTIEAFYAAYGWTTSVVYETSSSTAETPRFRAVIPLAEPVSYSRLKRNMKLLGELFPGADPTCFACGHCFYLPPKFTADGRENKVLVAGGERMYLTEYDGWIDEDYVEPKFERRPRPVTGSDFWDRVSARMNHLRVMGFDSVQHYLSTSYPLMQGNGDSSTSLYRACVACIMADDYDALDSVLEKARLENWSERELDRIVCSIEARKM